MQRLIHNCISITSGADFFSPVYVSKIRRKKAVQSGILAAVPCAAPQVGGLTKFPFCSAVALLVFLVAGTAPARPVLEKFCGGGVGNSLPCPHPKS